MPTANSSENPSTPSTSDLINVAEACQILSISQQTLRNWTDLGYLQCWRFGSSGWRKYSRKAVLAYAYGETESESAPVVVYCRVSTSRQKTDGNLERQKDRCVAYAKEHYPEREIIEICEDSSGMNWLRPGFVKLIQMVVNGELSGSVIISEFQDRLGRVAVPLLNVICEQKGVKLVFIEQQNATDDELLQQDLLATLYAYQIRSYAKRGSDKLRKAPPEDVIKYGRQLLKKGYSFDQVADLLAAEGKTNSDGSKISAFAVRKYISLFNKLESVSPKTEKTSVELYHERVVKKESAYRTTQFHAYEHYKQWATEKGLPVLSLRRLCAQFKEYEQSNHPIDGKVYRCWKGIILPGVPHKVVKELKRKSKLETPIDFFLSYYDSKRGFSGKMDDFYKSYKSWCVEKEIEPLKKIKTSTILEQLGAETKQIAGTFFVSI